MLVWHGSNKSFCWSVLATTKRERHARSPGCFVMKCCCYYYCCCCCCHCYYYYYDYDYDYDYYYYYYYYYYCYYYCYYCTTTTPTATTNTTTRVVCFFFWKCYIVLVSGFWLLNQWFRLPTQRFWLPNQWFRLPTQRFWLPNQRFWLPNQRFWLPNQRFWLPNHSRPQRGDDLLSRKTSPENLKGEDSKMQMLRRPILQRPFQSLTCSSVSWVPQFCKQNRARVMNQ